MITRPATQSYPHMVRSHVKAVCVKAITFFSGHSDVKMPKLPFNAETEHHYHNVVSSGA